MTGYASLRGSVRDSVSFTLAMKSVNHRFLDLNLRLPSYCDGLEVQMRRMLKERRASMLRLRGFAEEMSGLRNGVREAQFDRLRSRLVELTEGVPVSEERLLTEAAVLAEKSDIEEEIVRLRTHVDRFLAML